MSHAHRGIPPEMSPPRAIILGTRLQSAAP